MTIVNDGHLPTTHSVYNPRWLIIGVAVVGVNGVYFADVRRPTIVRRQRTIVDRK